MKSLGWFLLAAVGEIAGCFAFWMWLRHGKHATWSLPGLASLTVFAWALTHVETSHAGRAYAAYGGIYILLSILWLWLVEGIRPDRWDLTGMAVCLLGAGIILYGPRTPRLMTPETVGPDQTSSTAHLTGARPPSPFPMTTSEERDGGEAAQ